VNSRKLLLSGLLAGAAAFPAWAQEPAPPPAPADTTPADAAAAAAEPDPEAADDADAEEGEDIVITGTRERGAVIGDIEPEVQLNRRDIRSYGAGSISELLDALAPQTASTRGRGGERPVVLLNGRRISGFNEIRDLPPEAIERVDILPEEAALQYGYRADQRVVNFVLRRRFRALTTEVNAGISTEGDRASYGAEANYLRLNTDGRWNVSAEYNHANPLFESQRGILQGGSQQDPTANVDIGQFRTLLSETDTAAINGTYNRTIFGNVSATANASIDWNRNLSSFGLPSGILTVPAASPFASSGVDETIFRYSTLGAPLTRTATGNTIHAGVALNGDILPWRWSFTGNYDRTLSRTVTDNDLDLSSIQAAINGFDPSVNPLGPLPVNRFLYQQQDRARSVSQVGSAQLVLNGPLFQLPAGKVTSSIRAGFQARGLDSETFRSGLTIDRSLSREEGNVQANVTIPIASRRNDVLAAIGDLSLNLNAELEQLSDFGTLKTFGGGLNWSPVPILDILASFTDEEGAPSMQQLGDPLLETPNVRVFDFVRGETANVTLLTGGNPALTADHRRVFKLGSTLRPFSKTNLSLTANYTNTRITDPIASFPTATPEIEAAFPERFQRDENGRLLRIDSRPVNFARSDRSEIRWGLNFSKPIGPQPPAGGFRRNRPGGDAAAGATPSAAQAVGAAAPAGAATGAQAAGGQGGGGWRGGGGGAGGRGGFGGGRGGFGGGGRGGVLNFSIYHTWRLHDTVLIREGVPELDFLNGSAAGNNGGRPRHEVEFQGGITKNGLGARLSANWQSGTTVRGGLAPGGTTTDDLFFSDLLTFNLRLFADLGAQRTLVRAHPFFRGSRVTLSVNNLFNNRLDVRDSNGVTPLSYQPGYIDPLGRSIRISFRKMFF
jgi:iron complex outermembrane receptor protein